MHVKHAIQDGFKNVMIIANDTDVVVLALYYFHRLQVETLWIRFGVGRNISWIPIHEIADELGEEKCSAIVFWFIFTGCDTVSSFGGRGKRTAWEVWQMFPESTSCFTRFE